MSFPAFKEWHVIVEALGSGEQILILRKGGIAEGGGGFQLKEKRFWLFPTRFHAQEEKTKPAATKWFPPGEHEQLPGGMEASLVTLRYFAEVAAHEFIEDWSSVERLDAFHFWTEETVRERFEWSKPPGVHAFLVRVHRLTSELTFAPTQAMAGCKSWLDLAYDFNAAESEPVLTDEVFAKCSLQIGLGAGGRAAPNTPNQGYGS